MVASGPGDKMQRMNERRACKKARVIYTDRSIESAGMTQSMSVREGRARDPFGGACGACGGEGDDAVLRRP